MLKAEQDGDSVKVMALVVLHLFGIVIAQFDNYYNWPETSPPVVKSELHMAGKETRVRCHIKDRFRHIQNGLNLTWEYKACRSGHPAACMEEGNWSPLCQSPRKHCLPILTLVEPMAKDSGLYRCHITLDASVIILNIYMLQFIEKRREPPVIIEGMTSNVTVVASMVAVLQCKVRSPVPPTLRWFRRLGPPGSSSQLQTHFIQYLNNSYQLLSCCPVASLSQKNLYLSKLVIPSSSVFDSGFYICLAINDANYTYKEAYINVLPLVMPSREKPETESFMGLFLIPAALALIPAIAWMMCLRPRKLGTVDAPDHTHQPVETQRKSTQTIAQTHRHVQPLVQTHRQPENTQTLPLVSTSIQLDGSYLPVTISQPAPN